MRSCGINLTTIYPKISILDISLNITKPRLQPHVPGTNKLMKWSGTAHLSYDSSPLLDTEAITCFNSCEKYPESNTTKFRRLSTLFHVFDMTFSTLRLPWHYSDSTWALRHLKSLAAWLLVEQFVSLKITKNRSSVTSCPHIEPVMQKHFPCHAVFMNVLDPATSTTVIYHSVNMLTGQ